MKTAWWYVQWILLGFGFTAVIAVGVAYATIYTVRAMVAAGFHGISIPGVRLTTERVTVLWLALATWIAYRVVTGWYREAARKHAEIAERERLELQMGQIAPTLEIK